MLLKRGAKSELHGSPSHCRPVGDYKLPVMIHWIHADVDTDDTEINKIGRDIEYRDGRDCDRDETDREIDGGIDDRQILMVTLTEEEGESEKSEQIFK